MSDKKSSAGTGEIVCGDLVNTGKGTGLVIGFWNHLVLVAPTGVDGPFRNTVAYCEAWPQEQLVRRGWRDKPE